MLKRLIFLLIMLLCYWINLLGWLTILVSFLLSYFIATPIIWIAKGNTGIIELFFLDVIQKCSEIDTRILKIFVP